MIIHISAPSLSASVEVLVASYDKQFIIRVYSTGLTWTAIKENYYVDDLLDSTNSFEKDKALLGDVTYICIAKLALTFAIGFIMINELFVANQVMNHWESNACTEMIISK